jgi:hypothetical protein
MIFKPGDVVQIKNTSVRGTVQSYSSLFRSRNETHQVYVVWFYEQKRLRHRWFNAEDLELVELPEL